MNGLVVPQTKVEELERNDKFKLKICKNVLQNTRIRQ